MILIRFYKIISILLIFFSIFVFFSLYPTFSITKFVVKKNYEYFVLGNNFNKKINLYYDFLVQRYFRNNFIKQESDINKIAKLTKKYLVDQTESSAYGYDIESTYYGVSLGQVIILGYGACEGVNGVLGIRLSKNFKNIELFALFDDKKNTSPHTLLKHSKKDNDFFIDIHAPNRVHFFSFQNKINLSNEIFDKQYYEHHKDLFEKGFTIKKFDLFSYLIALVTKLQLIKNDIYSNSFETKLFSNHKKNIVNIDLQQTKKKYLAFQYIDARFEHILGNVDYAKKLYDDIIKTNCKYNFCKITEILKIKEEQF